MDNIFVDRLGNITVSNGIARLDFLTLKEMHKETNKADFEIVCRLNIPVDGIMQAIEVLENLKVNLLEQQKQKQNLIRQPSEKPEQIKPTEKSVEQEKKPKRKLTRAEFNRLTPEKQAQIRERAKLKEQERIKRQLEQ